MKKNAKTLEDLVEEEGNATAAAAKCGVSLSTFGRWLAGRHKPQGNNARRLRELGVAA